VSFSIKLSTEIYTNGMENFWSLLKRGLHGTYVSVELSSLSTYSVIWMNRLSAQ